MKRLYFILSLALLLLPGITFGAGASVLLGKTAAKIREAKSLEIEYTLSSDGQSMQGHLTLSGDRFVLSTNQLTSWYDGKTQWTYSTYMGEVNITEPTAEELAQVNPFSIMNSLAKDYTSSSVKAPAGYSSVLLKAKKKDSDISSATFTINNATGYPSSIKMTLSGGREITINIKSIKAGGARPITDFRFNPKDFPSIQVVDLR